MIINIYINHLLSQLHMLFNRFNAYLKYSHGTNICKEITIKIDFIRLKKLLPIKVEITTIILREKKINSFL